MITLSGHTFEWMAAAGSLGLAGLGEGLDPLRQLRRRFAYYTGQLDHQNFVTVTKTITTYPRKGNFRFLRPWTSIRRLGPRALVNNVSLTNPGIRVFIDNYYPKLVARNIPFVISVAPESPIDAEILAHHIAESCPKTLAIEANLYCPNAWPAAGSTSDRPNACGGPSDRPRIASALATYGHPVILKLPYNYDDICDHFTPAAVCLINAVPAAGFRSRADGCSAAGFKDNAGGLIGSAASSENLPQPSAGLRGLPAGQGAYSGEPIAGIAFDSLVRFHKAYPQIPVISCGGIFTWATARARLDAGASAVASWTAIDADPLGWPPTSQELP